MKRFLLVCGIVVAIALVAGAAVVSYASTRRPRTMVGVVVAPGAASIEATDQLGAQDAIVVDRVVAPAPCWVVVSNKGMGDMPAGVVAYVHVPAGVSTDVRVPLDPNVRLSEYAIVSLQADAGVSGRFEFEQARFDASPDKPYWSGGRAVKRTIWVRFNEMSNAFRG